MTEDALADEIEDYIEALRSFVTQAIERFGEDWVLTLDDAVVLLALVRGVDPKEIARDLDDGYGDEIDAILDIEGATADGVLVLHDAGRREGLAWAPAEMDAVVEALRADRAELATLADLLEEAQRAADRATEALAVAHEDASQWRARARAAEAAVGAVQSPTETVGRWERVTLLAWQAARLGFASIVIAAVVGVLGAALVVVDRPELMDRVRALAAGLLGTSS